MNSKDSESFLIWHEKQVDHKFDLQQELYKNCLSDVNILKNGCLMYRERVYENNKNR